MKDSLEAFPPHTAGVDRIDTDILAALKRCLRREGYEILTVDSPLDGVVVLEERAVDLVMSDHKMPGMSGLDFLAKAARLRPEARRILITGWPGEVSREVMDRLQVRALITKPWDDTELKNTLRRVLAD